MTTSIRWAMAAALSMSTLVTTMGTAEAATEPVDAAVSEALRAIAVKTSLVTKLGTDALGISVSVSGDTATLTGQVSKAASQGLAEDVALSVEGIAHVENRVIADAPPTAMDSTRDAVKNSLLEMKVKSALLGEVGTNALKIDVQSVDGVVSLRGHVDHADTANAALRRAKAVAGVRKVINLID